MADQQVQTTHDVPPEEEELFKEFQSYVRSIYAAATEGAVQSLQQATEGLRREVIELQKTVSESRQGFVALFDPAVQNFNSATEKAIKEMVHRQEAIAKQQDERFEHALQNLAAAHRESLNEQAHAAEQALQKQSAEHKMLAKVQSDSLVALIETRSQRLLWAIISSAFVLLIALVVLAILLRR